ncbi:tetratricopeptide repeat protein [Candidatus Aerophobetes bacterium]|nr:tetratricopeptide repeat protein [Candidatus Aerophobetes bacterium]
MREEYIKKILARIRKSFLVFLVCIIIIFAGGAGFYIYAHYQNKSGYQKYIQARTFYFQREENGEQQINNLNKAVKLFRELLGMSFWSGNKEEVFFYLGDSLYRLGDTEGSLKVFSEFNRRYPSSYFSPFVKLKIAFIYEEKKDYAEAIKFYRSIYQDYGRSAVAPEALLGEARCQEASGNIEEAQKLYQTLISRYPLSFQAQIAEAKVQQLNIKKENQKG